MIGSSCELTRTSQMFTLLLCYLRTRPGRRRSSRSVLGRGPSADLKILELNHGTYDIQSSGLRFVSLCASRRFSLVFTIALNSSKSYDATTHRHAGQ